VVSPVLIVPQKDKYRICIDYRKLNEGIKYDLYPIPDIHNIIHRTKTLTVFSKIDLSEAFYNVRIQKGNERLSVFWCHLGVFEYRVMPLGLAHAPATFQKFINARLGHLFPDNVFIYIDDILIASDDLKENKQMTNIVLETLIQNKLYRKLKKYEFFKDEIQFLGFVINGKTIRPSDTSINNLATFALPKTRKQLQGFISLLNYFRDFIENYSEKIKLLQKLSQQKKIV
jgi:Reverse transcriptase (RNA-dependent DNA polymerase)